MSEKSRIAINKLWSNPEYRQHMSDVHKGKIHSGSFKEGHTVRNTGRTRFKEGHKYSENWYKVMTSKTGEKSHSWKGDDVGYFGVHSWIGKVFGKPTECENCEEKNLSGHKIHWANLTGIYNRERKNWARLCVTCHNRFDKGLIELCLK